MPRLQAGEVQLGWREWGGGGVTVVFIHGNLASKDWIELAAPPVPSRLRVDGIYWGGGGHSVRPHHRTDLWRLRRYLDRDTSQPHTRAGKWRTGAPHAGNPSSTSRGVG